MQIVNEIGISNEICHRYMARVKVYLLKLGPEEATYVSKWR